MKNFAPSRTLRHTLLGASLLFTMTQANANEPFPNSPVPAVPEIDAEAYILIDYNSGKVLAEKNADQRRDPASLTKMMTSYVIGQAIKSGKIGAEDIVTVNEDA